MFAVVFYGWSCLKKKSSTKSTKKAKISVDVLSHTLVPDVSVLSEGEKTKLLKKYSISANQFPIIKSTDPVVEVLKAEPGNVIRIKRKEETGEYLAYRIVV
jgi:DNA-directed RNA polymerase subunit H (RpoH/RPB5)